MGNSLNEILKQLQDPDTSSSVIPLLIILTLLITGSILALAKLVSIFKVKVPTSLPKPTLVKPTILSTKRVKPMIVKPLRAAMAGAGGTVRGILKLIPAVDFSTKARTSNELDQLRELVRKLEQANALEREMHSRSLRKVGELQSELGALAAARLEERKLLEIERQRRMKLEGQVQRLEGQLRDAIRETERIYHQSAAVASSSLGSAVSKSTTVADILKDFPPSGGEPTPLNNTSQIVAQQAAEIQKLKQILQSCKVELLDKNKQ